MATKTHCQQCMWLSLLPQGISIPNVNSIKYEVKELLTYHCGCHGNLVTIAMRYVADAYHPKEPPYQIWAQYDIRQSELLTYHCCCQGNPVTIATRYVAGAILPIAF